MSGTVFLTDYPWPDVELERQLLATAGFKLVAGPSVAAPAAEIEALVAANDPLAIMTCWATVSAHAIRQPRILKVVARLGVGLDNIDIPAATARGAWVTNVPDYCVEEVSDHVIGLLLSHWRGLVSFDREAKQGVWNPARAQLRRVKNMTVGIIGYGHNGKLTAHKLSQGFGCRVLVTSPSLLGTQAVGTELAPRIQVADVAQIQRDADAIVLQLPLTATTRHLINDAFLQQCARRPLLINVSRGGLIDNDALLRALAAGSLSGAGLDVVEGEPAPPIAVLNHPDIVITPHVAFHSDAALLELRQRVCADVLRVLRGERPLHPCNVPGSQTR